MQTDSGQDDYSCEAKQSVDNTNSNPETLNITTIKKFVIKQITVDHDEPNNQSHSEARLNDHSKEESFSESNYVQSNSSESMDAQSGNFNELSSSSQKADNLDNLQSQQSTEFMQSQQNTQNLPSQQNTDNIQSQQNTDDTQSQQNTEFMQSQQNIDGYQSQVNSANFSTQDAVQQIKKNPSTFEGHMFYDNYNYDPYEKAKTLDSSEEPGHLINQAKTQPITPISKEERHKKIPPVRPIAHSKGMNHQTSQIEGNERKIRHLRKKPRTLVQDNNGQFSVKVMLSERKQTEITLIIDEDQKVEFHKNQQTPKRSLSAQSPKNKPKLRQSNEFSSPKENTRKRSPVRTNTNKRKANDDDTVNDFFSTTQRPVTVEPIPKLKPRRRGRSVNNKRKSNVDDQVLTPRTKSPPSHTKTSLMTPKIVRRKKNVQKTPQEYKPPKAIYDFILSSANSTFWNAAISNYYSIEILKINKYL